MAGLTGGGVIGGSDRRCSAPLLRALLGLLVRSQPIFQRGSWCLVCGLVFVDSAHFIGSCRWLEFGCVDQLVARKGIRGCIG